MNGAADMGGMHGFGPVEIERNEPVFHADCEKSFRAPESAVKNAYQISLDQIDEMRFRVAA